MAWFAVEWHGFLIFLFARTQVDQNKAKRAAISVASELGRGALAGSIGIKLSRGYVLKLRRG